MNRSIDLRGKTKIESSSEGDGTTGRINFPPAAARNLSLRAT